MYYMYTLHSVCIFISFDLVLIYVCSSPQTRDNLLNVVDDILSVNSAVLEETSETSDTSEK